jgi:hypothetical protein
MPDLTTVALLHYEIGQVLIERSKWQEFSAPPFAGKH